MDDFPNATPPPSSHGGRNIAIVVGAVFIIGAGFLVLKYWNHFSSPSSSELPSASQGAPQRVYTAEEKAKILESLKPKSSTGESAPASTSAAERAQILQQLNAQPAQPGNSSPSAPQPSAEEKMKLLQSLQH